MCRRETVMGSRFEKELCGPPDVLYNRVMADQTDVGNMQRNQPMRSPGN
jgi:hypothetical protein